MALLNIKMAAQFNMVAKLILNIPYFYFQIAQTFILNMKMG
jgi:hypothetical protein